MEASDRENKIREECEKSIKSRVEKMVYCPNCKHDLTKEE